MAISPKFFAYSPYFRAIVLPPMHVQRPLEFISPAYNPLVLRATQLVLPAWLKSRKAITHIQADNVEVLAELYQQFQTGKIRFLMAFRHPSTDDPLCMAYLLAHVLPQVAKEQNIPIQHPLHSHFIYDRGIPLWAGMQAGWLYSRLGGIPIHRGKVDRMSLKVARNLFANGNLPMAVAPEGATNGHNEIVSSLEPGVAQLGFWCVEDLLKAGRSEQVFIVPIGIQYSYVEAPWQAVEQILSQLEVDSGLEPQEESLYRRLYQLGEHLLKLMENFYAQFYPQMPKVTATEFTTRLQALLDIALKVAEQYFNISSSGSLSDRCRRVEQAGWDRIYREDIKNLDALSPLERGLANRIAEESNLRMWHMRLVESFVEVTGDYVLKKHTVERFAETTLLLWDMMTRIKGGNPFARPRLGKQRVQMTIGEPISVSDRWETYQANRRSAKQSITDLTRDLQTALEKMIK